MDVNAQRLVIDACMYAHTDASSAQRVMDAMLADVIVDVVVCRKGLVRHLNVRVYVLCVGVCVCV